MHRLFLSALALLFLAGPAAAETILFVGNSFTYGANSAAWKWDADRVTDLNGDGVGGVPALFKRFADQAGLDYQVSLETRGGASLAWHLAERRDRIDRAWDHVVLQDYSTLNGDRPGDPTATIRATRDLSRMFARANPRVRVHLTATWSRPDLVYGQDSRWAGTPIDRMARDVRAGYDAAARAGGRSIAGVVPVGEGFTCAIRAGVADPNPYDGTGPDQVDLWAYDRYHGSVHGYYLEALMVFGRITGRDPRTLGEREQAAELLGIAPRHAAALQRVAQDALASDGGCGR